MNKGAKIFLIVSLCILLIGMLLAAVGLSLVARRAGSDARRLTQEIANDVLNVQKARETDSVSVIGGADEPTDILVREEDGEGFALDLDAGFRELDIEMRLADLTILESEDGACRLEATGLKPGEIKTEQSGGKLRITDKRENRPGVYIGGVHVGVSGLSGNVCELRLYLPKGLSALEEIDLRLGAGMTDIRLPLEAEEIDIDLGAGEFKCQSLSADEIELSLGAGSFEAENADCRRLTMQCGAGEVQIGALRAEKQARIECGLGSVSLKNAALNDAKIDIGLGEFSLQGELAGKCQVNQGAGSAHFTLTNDPKDVRIRVDKGIGESKILVGGKSIESAARGSLSYGEDTAPNRIEVSGGLGEFILELP